MWCSTSKSKLNYTMKVKVNLIIFAVVFGSVFSSVAVAKDKKIKEAAKINAVELVKGQEKNFVTYVQDKFQPFSLQSEWKIIVEIVTLYNESPSKFLNLNKQSQQEFDVAVARFTEEATKNPEAIQWVANLEKTTKSIHFLWSVNWDNLATEESKQEEINEPIGVLNGF